MIYYLFAYLGFSWKSRIIILNIFLSKNVSGDIRKFYKQMLVWDYKLQENWTPP